MVNGRIVFFLSRSTANYPVPQCIPSTLSRPLLCYLLCTESVFDSRRQPHGTPHQCVTLLKLRVNPLVTTRLSVLVGAKDSPGNQLGKLPRMGDIGHMKFTYHAQSVWRNMTRIISNCSGLGTHIVRRCSITPLVLYWSPTVGPIVMKVNRW